MTAFVQAILSAGLPLLLRVARNRGPKR